MDHQVEPEGPESKKELRIRLPGFRFVAVTVGILVVIVIAVITGLVLHGRSRDPLPADIKQEAGFRLYYPEQVPAGFHFDEAKYDSSAKVVTYDYTNTDGNKIYFSLQPKPANFNFNDFNKKQLSGAHQIDTPSGTATIGILQQETVSSVVTDKSWVLISAGEKVSLDQLEQVSKSLTPVKQ